ncbi:AI-2E family transporter [Pediococcus ethanolidurans]|uniref:AI-2E family transporter n=2 Tax=Pediococcus ethanolidurans TaxID=319653 RepID=UPI001C1EC572|nr:AI-2E family transporter [Pediococcus ethanolidurans]MBU7563627.1 AI-2E family transporter [Pediococcus ethanolidurans]MCT4397892.1 AI-2E family transporter [Pediococcus ethanolidurans]MCV3322003.1 AI-2E family transporter [Pediococcus ethanolidurans]MCV3324259.1 AI-2E family transporter [Pediococcus ethanolidurans]MCV3328258.1 AI-2E family transporter [Pediococcus ethanolidurans]
MFDKIRRSPLMFWTLELLIVATLIYVCTKINFLFAPIGTFISTVFVPVILSGFLFYLLNPLVKLIQKIKYKKFHINHTWAVVIVFLLLIGIIGYALGWMIPRLVNQVAQLIESLPSIASNLQTASQHFLEHSDWIKNVDLDPYIKKMNSSIGTYAESILSTMTSSIGTLISTITSVTVVIITVPVMLFYMLKDGWKLMPTVKRLLPTKNADTIVDLFDKMSATLSSYIAGQVLECLFVGTFTAIGYVIIGQPYALLLGVVAGICNIVPYVGPYIGIFPALLVALTDSTMQVVWVIVVVLIVQQVDGNLIYPNIIGRSLQVHPLTIIILLLAAGKIAGIPGMILAIPAYAVVKVIVEFVYHIWILNSQE